MIDEINDSQLQEQNLEENTEYTCEDVLRPLLNKKLIDGQMLNGLVRTISLGKNQIEQKTVQENLNFDKEWIKQIEGTLFSIEKISKAPKSGILEDRIVVPVEKSKKINSESVRHLSSHTNNIRGFDDDGFVRPSKILNIELDEDKLVYENRFVYALIKKLLYFVDTRLNLIRDKTETYNTSTIYHNSEFKLNQGQVTYNLQMKVKKKIDEGVEVEQTKQLIETILSIKKRLNILQATDFCRALAKAKLLLPPIMKTNTLAKNVDYANCYRLWLYISSYTELGFSVDVSDKTITLDTDYVDDLSLLTAMSVKVMIENDLIRDTVRKPAVTTNDKVRRYKIVDKISYEPDSKKIPSVTAENDINQFYFDKIKAMIKKLSNPGDSIINRKEINPNFSKFFKALNDLNVKLYEDVLQLTEIKSEKPKEPKKTTLEAKKEYLAEQKKKVAKLNKLSKLMMTSAKQQLTKETKEADKAKKLENEIAAILLKQKQEKEKAALKAKAAELKKQETARIKKMEDEAVAKALAAVRAKSTSKKVSADTIDTESKPTSNVKKQSTTKVKRDSASVKKDLAPKKQSSSAATKKTKKSQSSAKSDTMPKIPSDTSVKYSAKSALKSKSNVSSKVNASEKLSSKITSVNKNSFIDELPYEQTDSLPFEKTENKFAYAFIENDSDDKNDHNAYPLDDKELSKEDDILRDGWYSIIDVD